LDLSFYIPLSKTLLFVTIFVIFLEVSTTS